MTVHVFNMNANESRTHLRPRRYNSIYENHRDFNQRETLLINAPHAAPWCTIRRDLEKLGCSLHLDSNENGKNNNKKTY